MKLSWFFFVGILVAGCSTAVKEEASFPLPYVEVRFEETVRLTAFADGPRPFSFESIGIVIYRPEEYRGKTVVLNFDSREVPDYKMLSESRGSMIDMSAKDGRGHWSGAEIGFTSRHRPVFKKEPKPAASHGPKRPWLI